MLFRHRMSPISLQWKYSLDRKQYIWGWVEILSLILMGIYVVSCRLSPEGEEILPRIKMCNKNIIYSIGGQLGALQPLYVLLLNLNGKYISVGKYMIYQLYLPNFHNLWGDGCCNPLSI